MLTYNDNILEHRNIGDTLGQLIAGIKSGSITTKTPNAFYSGFELRALNISPAPGGYYLKKDNPGTGIGARTKNRVVIEVGTDNKPIKKAYFWRHDSRIDSLSDGFFTRAARWGSI